jgi:hypothetical protein
VAVSVLVIPGSANFFFAFWSSSTLGRLCLPEVASTVGNSSRTNHSPGQGAAGRAACRFLPVKHTYLPMDTG